MIICFLLLESFDKKNHFEQLCINFINEKVQQMFIKMMLKSEQEWYASENVEIPEIPFLDNHPILGKRHTASLKMVFIF